MKVNRKLQEKEFIQIKCAMEELTNRRRSTKPDFKALHKIYLQSPVKTNLTEDVKLFQDNEFKRKLLNNRLEALEKFLKRQPYPSSKVRIKAFKVIINKLKKAKRRKTKLKILELFPHDIEYILFIIYLFEERVTL